MVTLTALRSDARPGRCARQLQAEVIEVRYEAGRFGRGFKAEPKSLASVRVVPMCDRVREAIARRLAGGVRPEDLVLPGPGGSNGIPPGARAPLSTNNLRRVYKAAVEAARGELALGLPRFDGQGWWLGQATCVRASLRVAVSNSSGGHVAKGAVQPGAVEPGDVLHGGAAGGRSGGPRLVVETLAFQGGEERLGKRVTVSQHWPVRPLDKMTVRSSARVA
jgi:hypothetical protein